MQCHHEVDHPPCSCSSHKSQSEGTDLLAGRKSEKKEPVKIFTNLADVVSPIAKLASCQLSSQRNPGHVIHKTHLALCLHPPGPILDFSFLSKWMPCWIFQCLEGSSLRRQIPHWGVMVTNLGEVMVRWHHKRLISRRKKLAFNFTWTEAYYCQSERNSKY